MSLEYIHMCAIEGRRVWRGERVSYLLEVGSHDRVQDPLTVCLVHDEEGLHLWQKKTRAFSTLRAPEILRFFVLQDFYNS